MSGGLNYGYDNYQYRWNNSSPQYVHRDPIITYDVPLSHNDHLVFNENPVVLEEEHLRVNYKPTHVERDEQYFVPANNSHRHHDHSTGPRKVHFVEHEEKVTKSVDSFGNHKVYKESVDTEADGFIKLKHKNFESSKTRTFDSFY
ncbi:hypothetical protein R6Q59_034076 [Mikania micrantha]|uniref:Uncharacterized protein n=1 Tax=Mikania micrantha TaxID=192012 RepID=A0A5N6NJ02_9ASTR|nr:hypothetical protein E3N88_21105 [Mikania micrantha]